MAKLEKVPKNRLVLAHGEKSNGKCYVIIKGKVIVVRNWNPEDYSEHSSDYSDTESYESEEDQPLKPGMDVITPRSRSNSILKPTLASPKHVIKKSGFSPDNKKQNFFKEDPQEKNKLSLKFLEGFKDYAHEKEME